LPNVVRVRRRHLFPNLLGEQMLSSLQGGVNDYKLTLLSAKFIDINNQLNEACIV